MSSSVHVVNELSLNTILTPYVSSSKWVIVQDMSYETPIISKYWHIPSDESNFSVCEDLRLFLVVVSTISFLLSCDTPLKVPHCRWRTLINVLELLTTVTGLMATFTAVSDVIIPHLFFFFQNLGSELLNDALFPTGSKSLLLNKFMIFISNPIDMSCESFEMFAPQVETK